MGSPKASNHTRNGSYNSLFSACACPCAGVSCAKLFFSLHRSLLLRCIGNINTYILISKDRVTDSYTMINDESPQKNKKTKLRSAFSSHPSFSSRTEASVRLCLPEPAPRTCPHVLLGSATVRHVCLNRRVTRAMFPDGVVGINSLFF